MSLCVIGYWIAQNTSRLCLGLRGLKDTSRNESEKRLCISPFWGQYGHPPAFDLAELCVWHLNLERELRNPYVQFKLCAHVAVGEVHQHLHFALGFLPIHKNVVTPVWHLQKKIRTWNKVKSFLRFLRKISLDYKHNISPPPWRWVYFSNMLKTPYGHMINANDFIVITFKAKSSLLLIKPMVNIIYFHMSL